MLLFSHTVSPKNVELQNIQSVWLWLVVCFFSSILFISTVWKYLCVPFALFAACVLRHFQSFSTSIFQQNGANVSVCRYTHSSAAARASKPFGLALLRVGGENTVCAHICAGDSMSAECMCVCVSLPYRRCGNSRVQL